MEVQVVAGGGAHHAGGGGARRQNLAWCLGCGRQCGRSGAPGPQLIQEDSLCAWLVFASMNAADSFLLSCAPVLASNSPQVTNP